MAKTSMVEREKKRVLQNTKFRELRLNLKKTISSVSSSDDNRWDALQKLQSLPRDSSYSRQRNRCRLCGRSRAFNRLTGLCRIHMRHAVMNGFVPGMRKASW